MPPLASEGIEQDRIEFWTNCSLPEITIRRQAFASLDAEVLWGASEGTFERLVKIALIGKSRYVCNLRNRIVRLTEHSGSSGKPDMIQIGDQRHAGHLFEIFHELRRAHSDQPRRRATIARGRCADADIAHGPCRRPGPRRADHRRRVR